MRLFPIHIFIKDLSFMIVYFMIMKYNLTNETYLPETISNFPGAPNMTIGNMFSASIFYNIVPIFISFIAYYPMVYLIRKIAKTSSILSILLTGFLLTTTTPLVYLIFSEWKRNDYYLKKAEILAWIFCFISSITVYYFLNKQDVKHNPCDKIFAG